ncbi:MAG: hypothetical protein N3B18_12160 [Desulfobacterota bacterium]|nr:hypothetical protein [Thermodesulfobacteriota bacterium]
MMKHPRAYVLSIVCMVCAFVMVAAPQRITATAEVSAAADATLTAITPDEIESAPVSQTKLFTILGSGLGFGRAQVVFTGPREDAIRTVFAFALNTRVLAIAVISANPEPGSYAVTVKRGKIEATGVSLTVIGDNQTTTTTVPGGFSRCTPCGDFLPQCDMGCLAKYHTDKNCPVCMSLSDNGSLLLKFEDGSSFTTENDAVNGKTVTTYKDNTGKTCIYAEYDWKTKEMVLYDRTGHACYSVKTTSGGEGQIILNNKTYTLHEDGSWTCPDGSTWTLPEGCVDNTLINEQNQNCPPVMQLPSCT